MEKVSNSTDRLFELMAYFNIRQVDICRKTGLTKSTLNNYCIRRREPKQDAIYKICQAYGVDVLWFMGYDTSMFSKQYGKESAIEDSEIIMLFSRLSDADKQAVKTLMENLAEK